MTLSPIEQLEEEYRALAHGNDRLTLTLKGVPGLPRGRWRLADLDEVLKSTKTGMHTKDGVWVILVERARTAGHPWTVTAAGLAMRGIRRAVNRANYLAPNIEVRADLEAAAIAGFLEKLGEIDLRKRKVAARLCQAAWVNARRHALELTQYQRTLTSPTFASRPPTPHCEHVDLVLADAVREQVITQLQARLILDTCIERQTLKASAKRLDVERHRASREREHAKRQLGAWITGHTDHPRHSAGHDDGPTAVVD